MEDTKKYGISKRVWLNALAKFVKILVAGICLWAMFLAVLFSLSPMTCSKIFNFFGAKSAEESCYKFEYKKTNSAESLYNLVVFEQGQGDYVEELLFIDALEKREDFNKFCAKLNSSAKQTVKSKALIAYTANVKSFLVNQKILAMRKTEMNTVTITDYIERELKGQDTEYSLAYFVNLILTDSELGEDLKKSTIENSIFKQTSLMDNFNKKTESLRDRLKAETDISEKIIIQFALLQNARANYNILKLCLSGAGAEESIELAKEAANSEQVAYAQLLID